MLVLRAAVNLAHMYLVSGVVAERGASHPMVPRLTICRLAMLVRRGLWFHQCRMNFPLQLPAGVYLPLPLSFKTRMPISFRLDLGLVLRASAVNLAQNPLPSFCRPVLLGGSLLLRFYLLIQVALATQHRMRHRHFPQEWEADFLPPADHILSSP